MLITHTGGGPLHTKDHDHATAEPWLNKRQLADHLGVSPRSIERRMNDGMPFARFGRCPRFRRSTAERWLFGAEGCG